MQTDETKDSIEKLTEKIDELLIVLNRVTEDLIEISKTLKTTLISNVNQKKVTFEKKDAVKRQEEKVILPGIKKVRGSFPKDLENLLIFEEKGNYVIVKPRLFLGSENFAKIASIIRDLGGDYVSAGKESHFRIPLN